MATNSVQAVLIEARRLIVDVGWCQRAYTMRSGTRGKPCAFCARGAILHADPSGFAVEAKNALMRAIERINIEGWNDDPHRTQSEVVAAFDRAIELAGGAT